MLFLISNFKDRFKTNVYFTFFKTWNSLTTGEKSCTNIFQFKKCISRELESYLKACDEITIQGFWICFALSLLVFDDGNSSDASSSLF